MLEDNGEGRKEVHVSWLKPWYPTAKEIVELEKKCLLNIFNEESDDENFLGFPTRSPSHHQLAPP